MGFLSALRRVLGAEVDPGNDRADRLALAESFGVSDTSHPEFPNGRAPAADPAEMAAPPATTDYDTIQWRKKLKRILEHLPDAQGQWADLLQEAGALGLDPQWVARAQREEFALIVRRIVSDRVVTPQEHQKLELARTLIGIPESEAVATLNAIVAEAAAFFGKSIEGA